MLGKGKAVSVTLSVTVWITADFLAIAVKHLAMQARMEHSWVLVGCTHSVGALTGVS